ncbi:MAG: bifunctional endoribonuclease/protein kinase ire1 [Peltula sp. TS41687]|nr:MAG: bifunctional endoribonuclease/protein kinase ire1 [Peltula sp. TS41687]
MPGRLSDSSRTVRSSFAALLLLVPLILAAQQQQQQYQQQQQQQQWLARSLTHEDEALAKTISTARPSGLRNHHHHHVQRSHGDLNAVISSDASAVATLAPAHHKNAVRAPPAGPTGKSLTALSTPLDARSLQDWEVEDFVLLATVDGTIHARDRKTGAPRWALEMDRPMVEATYYRPNQSAVDERDDLLWIVEPTKDGDLYIYRSDPRPGLQKLGLTVRKLVEELSPYAGDDPPVVYTAEKKNTLYTVDAGTGRILKVFNAAGSSINDETSCRRVTGLEALDEEECGRSGTLTLGRTEYVVSIQNGETADPICTLRYSEWGPNNRDGDLQSQYVSTMDKKYVYSRHDGSIFGFDHAQIEDRRKSYTQKFSSPVVRVFDIARPAHFDAPDAPLVILAQPNGPTDSEELSVRGLDREGRIFINRTETGGWYAMSEQSYPLATGGATTARCYSEPGRQVVPLWDKVDSQQSKALIGVHSLLNHPRRVPTLPAISAPENGLAKDAPVELVKEQLPAQVLTPSTSAIAHSRLLGYAAQNAVDIGILFPFFICFLFLYFNRSKLGKLLVKTLDVEKIPGVKEVLMSSPPSPAEPDKSFLDPFKDTITINVENDGDDDKDADEDESPIDPSGATDPISLVENETRTVEQILDDAETALSPAQPKKKKTHRGQRGGAGRNKKSRKDSSSNKDQVDRVVEEAKEIGRDSPLEPDVVKAGENGASNVTDVSSTFQINNLIVTDKVLGYGSHGTIVYRGSFEGREVAVKRMLLEFYDVASHEVGLLQESDDHPNVIRYFCRQQSAGFLYIALELCPASLQDVVEKPWEYASLSQASNIDLPNVLYQIAAGVRYLHSLKIVHRDLKPQNILVAPPKATRTNPGNKTAPRLLISDFGLCKKLEGDQSSFRATTAHAAGTSGWRAPELLVDDDPSHPMAGISESGHSFENSEPAIIDTLSNRRATRAIDIFSLGCVFFYILSRGNHPFGDRYMREANIVKGQYNLSQLEELADYGYEAIALISCMLDHDPRKRPDATNVIVHPFFWSPEKRLNFLVDVSDHFEWESRDPPSDHLQALEATAPEVFGTDFLRRLDRAFIDTLGKQRKYTGSRMLDLLRALRNKKNHYQDMPEHVKAHVGPLPEGYLAYWTHRFPTLLLQCYSVVVKCRLDELPRFKPYLTPPP